MALGKKKNLYESILEYRCMDIFVEAASGRGAWEPQQGCDDVRSPQGD